ncbi:MAG: glycerol-3-phosphate dehydrogenase [Nevskia sp.]|nr:glycerol-3-phosphate dehydrogenase [Nevskia sp.]
MKRLKRVTVLGGGSWGTTVASLVSANAATTLWIRNEEAAEQVNREHRNPRYLGELALHAGLRATASLQEALSDCDVLVLGVPSHAMREILRDCAPILRPWVPVISLAKGLEQGSHRRMTQIINEELPGHPAGVLAGPNIAREVLQGMAAAAVIAMTDEQVGRALQPLFGSRVFRVYLNTDVIGCELGGPLKNVIAISAGMGDGLGVGHNTRSLVITRGLAEITRLGVALGGRAESFAGLTGLGDLLTTCMSPLSRNRQVGERLAHGESIPQIVTSMHMVAEGIKTSTVVMELAEKYQLKLPIAAEVSGVVKGERTVAQAFRGLRGIAPGSEHEAA